MMVVFLSFVYDSEGGGSAWWRRTRYWQCQGRYGL